MRAFEWLIWWAGWVVALILVANIVRWAVGRRYVSPATRRAELLGKRAVDDITGPVFMLTGVLVGLVITAVWNVSKLHLLWWVPIALPLTRRLFGPAVGLVRKNPTPRNRRELMQLQGLIGTGGFPNYLKVYPQVIEEARPNHDKDACAVEGAAKHFDAYWRARGEFPKDKDGLPEWTDISMMVLHHFEQYRSGNKSD